MSRALHRRVVRRHTLRTAVGIALLLVLVLAGHLGYQWLRASSAIDEALVAAAAPIESWDWDAADRALAEAERLATNPALRAELETKSVAVRQQLRDQRAREQALAVEAAFLAEARARGIDVANFAETRRRAKALDAALSQVGAAAASRLRAKAGDLDGLMARCESVADGLRGQVDALVGELEAAAGGGDRLADPAKAGQVLGRIRAVLGAPGANIAVGNDTNDRALALIERVSQRLALEQARDETLRRLDAANDPRSYLEAVAKLAADTADTPERRAAQLVTASAANLRESPRNLLGPRLGAMWDAAASPEPKAFVPNPEESALVTRLTEDSPLRNLRKYIIREHVSPAPGVSESRVGEAEYVSGNLNVETRRLPEGTETLYTAKVLRSSGDLVDQQWSLRTFNNGVVSGKEPTEGLPLPEVEHLRRWATYFKVAGGQLAEPPLRTLERVRRETGSPILRAYHLQELFRLAAIRPSESGLAFSPSAQRDAAELRGITQNNLQAAEFVFGNDKALKTELAKFHARPDVAYVAEAQYLRALVEALRRGNLTLVGRVGLDGRPGWRHPAAPGSVIVGLDTEGKPTVLYECGADGEPQPLANPAPLSPLLRLTTTPAEAAEAAGKRPGELPAPAGGWNSLLKGKDL